MVTSVLRLVFGIAVLLGPPAAAQEFIFVTGRMSALPSFAADGQLLSQNELFLYRDGSQIRLTFTPEVSEWDPRPSPSGRYLAYVVNQLVTDWEAVDVMLDGVWHLRIMDLETLEILQEWELPDTTSVWRPAGGFDIEWSEQEDWLLVQLLDADGSGRIGRVEPGDPDVRVISPGFGVGLQRDSQLLATNIDGYAMVYDMSADVHHVISVGEGLGWLGTNFVIGGQDQLVLYDFMTGSERVLADHTPGYYPYFASDPEGTRHAWLRYEPDFDGTHVTVVDGDFEPVTAWDHHAHITSIDFVDGQTLLLTVLAGAFDQIVAVELGSFQEHPLVSTVGFDNTTPVLLPAAAPGP